MPETTSPLPLESLSSALSDAVARAAPGVVAVHSHRSRSSGFVWRPGMIVTADEALAEEGEISVVLPGGSAVSATLVGRDPTTDIGLLRTEAADVAAVSLDTGMVATGGFALAVGSQEGAPVAAFGIVSVAGPGWRSMRGGEIDARIELDLNLARHAEGGVALDAAGRALGMAVFGPRRRVLVIPAATIERVAAKLATHGRIARGYLGLGLQPVRLDDGSMGAMVMSVDGKGPGAQAGVRQGDVLTAWNGRPVESIRSFLRGLGAESVGTAVNLSLRRAGEPLDLTLTVGERPQG